MTASLAERIRAGIAARILSGELPPGARLPVEHELMAAHGCSRMTVSKALSALAAAGLIERRRRAGSFVARPRAHAMVLDVPDLAADVAARGQRYRFELIERAVRRPRTADERALAGDGDVLLVRGLHHADDAPLAYEHRLVNLAAVPAIAAQDFAHAPPGSWLIRHVPWTEAENRIGATAADPEAARRLALPPRAACLAVERRTWRGADGITHVRQLFPGGGYEMVARFGGAGVRGMDFIVTPDAFRGPPIRKPGDRGPCRAVDAGTGPA